MRAASHVRWLLVGWLFVLSAVAFLDRVNLSIAGGVLANEYRISDIQLGWIFSAFLLGYALFQTPAGWLADRLGARRVLTMGVGWWGLFTALTALAPRTIGTAIPYFVSVRFLLGAGEAVIYPASNQFVSRWIPSQERGLANGIIFAGVGVGAGLTPPLIAHFMLNYGWRASFWVCAAVGIGAGLVWFIAARDRPDQHPSTSAAELDLIRSGLTANTIPVKAGATVPWRGILRNNTVWFVTLSYFCFGYVAWVFFSWFFIYLARVRGLNLKSSGFYGSLPFLAMALCCPLGGFLSDWTTTRFGKKVGRCGIAALGSALAGIFILVGAGVDGVRSSAVILAGGAGALYLSQSSFWSLTADIGGESAGSVSGLMNMGAQLGGALTASLTPYIAIHFGWITSFAVAAALSAVGSLLWLLVDPGAVVQKTT